MRNRIVGLMIVGIALLIGIIIYLFNKALTDIVNASCTHGPACSMWGAINFQTRVSIVIMAFVLLIGLYLVFFGREERIVTKVKLVKEAGQKKLAKESYKKIIDALGADERKVFVELINSQGSIYQSDLIGKTGFTKVKVTRILDRLEGKGLVERKRRGMTNIIILKHN